MKCAEADAFIHAYVDGELAGVDRDSYEQHLVECDQCSRSCRLQARFKAAVRGHLPRPPVPEGLQLRIQTALSGAPPIRRRFFWHTYPRLVPAAAAAVVLLGILSTARTRRSPVVLEQAMLTFNSTLPMDVVDSNCTSVVNWFRGRLGFAMPSPPRNLGNCQGGRVVNVLDRFGAYVVYQAPTGHRLAILVFNAGDEALDGRRRVVAGREVYFGTARGTSTAAYRDRDGLYYVLTADVDEEELGNLLEAALHDQR